jgi:hypothetical protein
MIRSIVSTLALTAAASLGIAAPASAADISSFVATGCSKVVYNLESDETTGVHYYTFRLDGDIVHSGALYAGQSVSRMIFPLPGHHTARIVVDGTVVAADASGACYGFGDGPRR